MERFDDDLGSVKISKTYIERDRDEEVWDEMEEKISGIIMDKIHFSEIKSIECQPESAPPVIEIEIDAGWRKMPFSNTETCRNVFKRLRYQYSVFNQNY